MNTPTKLAGFAAAAGAILGLAILLGSAVGPLDHPDQMSRALDSNHAGGNAEPGGNADVPGGLMVSQNGHTLDIGQGRAHPGDAVRVSFQIKDAKGEPVTSYDVEHGKRLHLIAVRRDFTGFQHVHPTLAEDGTWSTDLALTPGTWRLFADFKATGGEPVTLGSDLAVAGDYQPAEPARDTRVATVDGYEVTLGGDLKAGSDAKLTLSVTKDGKPVTDLQPYLGAFGHLVSLRAGDLAYLHVHPDGTPGDGRTEPGPDVVFYAAVPTDGTYHLYLDFQHDGVVRTAAFTVTAASDGTAPVPAPSPTTPTESDGHGH